MMGDNNANSFNKLGGVASNKSVGEGSSEAGGTVEDTNGEAVEPVVLVPRARGGDRNDDEFVVVVDFIAADITRRLGSVQSVSILYKFRCER